jgi:cell division septation protein DedD
MQGTVNQRLKQSRQHREDLPENPQAAPGLITVNLNPTTTPAKITHKFTPGRNLSMFFGWAAAGAAIVILLWWVKPDRAPDDMSLMVLQPAETIQINKDTGTQSRVTEVRQPSERGTDPDEDVERLTDSITYLESQLKIAEEITDSVIEAEQKPALSTSPEQPAMTEAAQGRESLPPPVVADPASSEIPVSTTLSAETAAGRQSSSRKPLSTEVSKGAATERQDPATRKQPAVSMDTVGPWVINLASSSSEAAADRLAEKARSRGIQTQQQPVTVKGKQFWRVQITGFSTQEQARAYADTAREKLGLKYVWIMKR